ncbi:MAG: hypothetical protein SGI71_04815 [Verrucomicrobiota bacterium]|nr:hypothetical protein [Verrucomicrobiota bacterium]
MWRNPFGIRREEFATNPQTILKGLRLLGQKAGSCWHPSGISLWWGGGPVVSLVPLSTTGYMLGSLRLEWLRSLLSDLKGLLLIS